MDTHNDVDAKITQEVTPVSHGVAMPGGMLDDDVIDRMEKQITFRARLLTTALKAIRPHDFQDFGGKPYLEGEGAARIMAVIRGFKVGEPEFEVVEAESHFFIECMVPMEFNGSTTVAIGDCSTADDFFTGKDGKSGQYGRNLHRTGSEKIAARLVLGNAKKKARENALSRGVSELLGIKGLEWKDLGELGFSRQGAGSTVKFTSGGQGGEVQDATVASALTDYGVGSKINIVGGVLTDIKEHVSNKGGKETSYTDYTIADGGKDIVVRKFGKAADIANDTKVYCKDVEVQEFRGFRKFLAQEVVQVEG